LLTCFGMAVSDDTVIRNLKRSSRQRDAGVLRVVGIDDWSWRKGFRFGTIMVDLERRTVVDVLDDRSSSSVAAWLGARPSIEIISRDRQGLYAEGARIGAPQARQVADRFHLVQIAMRFRGLLRGRDGAKLDPWLDQAYYSGIYALQRFARTLQGDLDAVRNAVTEPWSRG
jgi:transposase